MDKKMIELSMTVKRIDIMNVEKIIELLSLFNMNENVYFIKGAFLYPSEEKGVLLNKEQLLSQIKNMKLMEDGEEIYVRKNNMDLTIKSDVRVSGFARIFICGELSKKEIFKCRDILFSFFHDQFYTCYIHKLNFQKYNKYTSLYIGIYISINYYMAFGCYVYEFLPKEKLLSYKSAYRIYEKDNIVNIWLFEDMINTPEWIETYKIKKFQRKMKIKKVINNIKENIFWDENVKTLYLRGHEDYSKEFLEQNSTPIKIPQNQYQIQLVDNQYIILKKYKKSHFYFVEESMNAAEVLGYFIYTKDGKQPEYHIYDAPAYPIVEISSITTIEEYCKKNRFDCLKLNDNHYELRKEENEVLTIMNYYELKELDIYYDITLNIDKKLFEEKMINALIDEYSKLIKYVKVKEIPYIF